MQELFKIHLNDKMCIWNGKIASLIGIWLRRSMSWSRWPPSAPLLAIFHVREPVGVDETLSRAGLLARVAALVVVELSNGVGTGLRHFRQSAGVWAGKEILKQEWLKWNGLTLCVCALLLALRTSFVPVLVSFAAAVLELLASSLPAVEEPARGWSLARAAVLGQPAEFWNSNKIVFSSFNQGGSVCVPPALCGSSGSSCCLHCLEQSSSLSKLLELPPQPP